MVNIEYTPDFLIPNNYHYEKERFPSLTGKLFCIFWVVEVSIPTLPGISFFLPWIAICSFLPPWTVEGSQLREEVKEEAKNTAYHGFFHP